MLKPLYDKFMYKGFKHGRGYIGVKRMLKTKVVYKAFGLSIFSEIPLYELVSNEWAYEICRFRNKV